MVYSAVQLTCLKLMIEIVRLAIAKTKNINVEITAVRLKKPNLSILVIAAMLKNSQTISTKPKGINSNQSEIVILVFSISLWLGKVLVLD